MDIQKCKTSKLNDIQVLDRDNKVYSIKNDCNENEINIKEKKKSKSSTIQKSLTMNKKIENENIKLLEKNDKKGIKEKKFISSGSLQKISLKIRKKNVKKVNFPKYMITIIEVESYKKYNYFNSTRESISCKCSIY
jgi:hypothetical protein